MDSLRDYVLKLMGTQPKAVRAILEVLTTGINDDIVMKLENLADRIDQEGHEAVLGQHNRGCESSAHICFCSLR